MKMSKLPPGLKELAKLRQFQCADKCYSKTTDRLTRAFSWDETPERFVFWDTIDDGNFTPFYNCKAVICKLKVP